MKFNRPKGSSCKLIPKNVYLPTTLIPSYGGRSNVLPQPSNSYLGAVILSPKNHQGQPPITLVVLFGRVQYSTVQYSKVE